jgi:hypothetical protein
MPLVLYEKWKPKPEALGIIEAANKILRDYTAQGYDLTLRQLYYQFVALNLFPATRRWSWNGTKWVRDPDGTINAQPNYDWLGTIINKGRMAGLVDWDFIVDRTRNLKKLGHWDGPAKAVETIASAYHRDLWARQEYRPEVWIEKDALAGVIAGVCDENDVPYFSCRGFTSLSEMWGAARRHLEHIKGGQKVVVFHLGDHDPSGIDMTRDVEDRLSLFITQDWANQEMVGHRGTKLTRQDVWHSMAQRVNIPGREAIYRGSEIRRLALNMDQVQEFNPPPNTAKQTDSRTAASNSQRAE